MKDKDAIGLKLNLVINTSCKDCNKVYIGQTKRYLKSRVKEHKDNYTKHPREHTALKKHQIDHSHRFDSDNVKILATEKNLKKEHLKKYFFIIKTKVQSMRDQMLTIRALFSVLYE